ncbi:MAG TPA: AAA family ATPase [Candidatus Bathyarchaeia archaeon]|nr:AAA family ATPase [Candidatus Bathyarchaeia archaeon]
MMIRILSDLLDKKLVSSLRGEASNRSHVFDKIVGYDGIKRTFLRSLSSKEPIHILLIGPPGQAKTLFLKCILETFGGKKAFFTVGGNASKSGLIDVLFDMQPKYLLVDEIEHLKPEYQTTLLSLMETGILTQTVHSKVRQTHLKTWIFATSNGTKKLSEPLLSRFRVMYLSEYEFSQFYEIVVRKLLADGLDKRAADEIAISVWEQLANPNIRNCVQIGRLVKNEPDIQKAIADEIQNFKEYGGSQLKRSTD